MRATPDDSGVLLSGSAPVTSGGPAAAAAPHSRYCVYDLVDHQFGDLVHGGLGPTLVAFAHPDDPQRALLHDVMEELGSDRLRCVLVDPDACPNAAARFALPGEPRYLLFVDGQQVERFDVTTTVSVLAGLIEEASRAPRAPRLIHPRRGL